MVSKSIFYILHYSSTIANIRQATKKNLVVIKYPKRNTGLSRPDAPLTQSHHICLDPSYQRLIVRQQRVSSEATGCCWRRFFSYRRTCIDLLTCLERTIVPLFADVSAIRPPGLHATQTGSGMQTLTAPHPPPHSRAFVV